MPRREHYKHPPSNLTAIQTVSRKNMFPAAKSMLSWSFRTAPAGASCLCHLWCLCFAQKVSFTPLLEWISHSWMMTSNNKLTPKMDMKLFFESSWKVESINKLHCFGNVLNVLFKGILYFQGERTHLMWITLSRAFNKELYSMGQEVRFT